MAGLEPRNPRTRKHCPPDLVLKEEARIPAISSSSLKPTRSFSSSNLQSQHQHIQGQGQGQGQIQGQQHNHQRGGGMASGATQFQPYSPYSPHFPSYRPYTPSAPSTPTTSVFGVAMPMTPSSAVTTFRPEHSSAGQGKADGTNAGSLHPFSKSQRTSSTRRMPSSEASLYDPYRSRQPSVSANRVKNEYQAQSPIRDSYSTLPQYSRPYYSSHGSSEEVRDTHSQLSDESYVMVPPSIGQREDQYRYSSQSVASTPYQAYFPYSVQNPLPSPSFKDKHRTSSNYSSPGLVPLYSPNQPYEEQQQPQRPSENKTDPYRSAYSQSSNHQLSNQSHGSLHQASSKGSPNPNDDFSSSYESRFSGTGQQQQQQQLQQQQNNSGNNDARYPMRDLAGQNSSQALSASFYEMEDLDLESSKKPGVKPLDKDHSATISNSAKHSLTRPSSVHPAQPFKADPSGSKKDITTEEDEDNDVILQKLGVLNADNASRSTSSGRSRPKSHWTDGSDEEAQRRPGAAGRRGANGRRNGRQAQCLCCSVKACAFVTFFLLVCLSAMLFFIIPRTPSFQYEAISPNGPPIVTNDRIREPFTFHFRVDNSNNYLPMRLNAINMAVLLKLDQTKIADNDHLPSSYVIQPHTVQEITVPMTLDYKSPTSDLTSDGTLQYLVQACMPLHKMENGALPPGLDITITGELQVWGLSWIWKPAFTIDVDDVPCPVNAKNMAAASEATSETTSETIALSVSS